MKNYPCVRPAIVKLRISEPIVMKNQFKILFLFIILLSITPASFSQYISSLKLQDKTPNDLKVGAQQTDDYLPLVKGKPIAVVAHPASLVNTIHLVDTLIRSGIKVKRIFAPEHGFRGAAEAGSGRRRCARWRLGLRPAS